MASTTSSGEAAAPDEGAVTLLSDFGRELTERRAAYEAEHGPLVVPRNSGTRRTESKRALLAEIDKAAAAKGFRW